MRVQCHKEEILSGIQQIQNVVSSRTTIPILSNVLIEADGENLTLTTTDLEVGMRCRFPAKISRPGTTTIPAKRFSSIIRELPQDQLDLEVSDNHVATIKCGSSFFRIMGLAKDEFPKFPEFKGVDSFQMEQLTLKEMLKQTAYCVSHDETRYVLNGVYLVAKENKVICVSTDGRRLALSEKNVELPKGFSKDVIIPLKAVIELNRILGDDGTVKIQFTENQIAFEISQCVLVSRLIDGHFPNYKQVIPEKIRQKVRINRTELENAVKRVSLLTTEKSNSVKFTFSDGKLVINANTPDVGEAREELKIEFDGEEVGIAFNPGFVLDVLKNLSEENVIVELIDSLNPGVFRSELDFLCVIMPMRMS